MNATADCRKCPGPESPRLARTRNAELHSAVPQNCILLRVRTFLRSRYLHRPADFKSAIRQTTNLCYFAARRRNAELHSAVPQNCILLRARTFARSHRLRRPADCKSAIQQITNLRYFTPAVRQITDLRYAECGSLQALLHLQASGVTQSRALTGLFTT